MAEGFVRVYRSLLDWEWYMDVPTRSLFQHLLLVVNWKPGKWMGIDIPPGSTVTSHPKLADGSGLTVKQVRRALANLVETGEITVSRAERGQLVTLRNWAKFQGEDETGAGKGQEKGRQRAGKGQAEGSYRRREEGERREEGKKQDGVDERLAAFRAQCLEIHRTKKILTNEEARKFFTYWSERSATGKKHRWEFQKTFDIAGRMVTWRGNIKPEQINGKSAPKPGFEQYAQQVAAAVGHSVGATSAPHPAADGTAAGALIGEGSAAGGNGVPNDRASDGLLDDANG